MVNYIGVVLCCCGLIVSICPFVVGAAEKPTKLVHDVCEKANRTSTTTADYNFCVNSLYSDPRTPTADRFVLAYVSFDLAYINATHTNNSISLLLHNSSSLGPQLRQCQSYYVKAIGALASAINDLNSETFYELGHLAVKADHAARDCESTFERGRHSPLSTMNFNLRGLSNICLVVSTLFSAPP